MFEFTLTFKNNTPSVVKTQSLNAGGVRGSYNSQKLFTCNLAGANLNVPEVSVYVRSNAVMSYRKYTAPLLVKTIGGVCDALNRLDVGLFWVEGSNICASNSLYNYLEIFIGIDTTGVDWVLRVSPPNGTYASIVRGAGLWVALSSAASGVPIATSPNGIDWIQRSTPFANAWTGVVYANGLFVAVGNTGTTSQRVMTSPDGINWTLRTIPEANVWNDITYGNGLFVAVASSGANRVMTSPDGITWTAQAAAAANSWLAVTYGNGRFVAVSSTGTNRVMTSVDGITWTGHLSPTSVWAGIVYANNQFVVTGTAAVMTSPDGINWTLQAAPAGSWRRVTYGRGLYVSVNIAGSLDSVMTSPDGVTWTLAQAATAANWVAIAFSDGMFVAVATGPGSTDPAITLMTSGMMP